MKKGSLSFLFFVFLCQFVHSQPQYLTPEAKITLLTCNRGSELYSAFGHSAIRVKDDAQHMDVVFNYGTFNFDEPGFYYNFLNGNMIFSLGVDHFDDFIFQYQYEKRAVKETELLLNLEEKNKVWHFLVNNAQPENARYRYDFLFDNCATRIRDVFENNVDGQISYAHAAFDTSKTFRDLIDDYSYDMSWENFGMNILIGLPVDRKVTEREEQFLPDYLLKAMESAVINQPNGEKRKLTSKTTVILEIKPEKHSEFFTPLLFFSLLSLAVLILSIIANKKSSQLKWLDIPLFSSVGVIGISMVFLWFFTKHTTTQNNFNILWLSPLYFIMAILFIPKSKVKLLNFLCYLSIASCILFFIGFPFLPQHFNKAFLPIAFIFLTRSIFILLEKNQSAQS